MFGVVLDGSGFGIKGELKGRRTEKGGIRFYEVFEM